MKPSGRLAAFAALGMLVLSSPASRAQDRDLSRPIGVEARTIDQIAAVIADPVHPINSVDEFIARLDPVMLKNYVLVKVSRSLQSPSTVTLPRIILFRPDGRLMLGIATNEDARNYDEVEMLEFTDDQRWRLEATNFRDAGVGRPPRRHQGGGEDGPLCMRCHGPNCRPIWGSYRAWSGAYANTDLLTADEAEALTRVHAPGNEELNPRLRKLTFRATTWRDGDGLQLPDQHSGFPNQTFNEAIAARHSEHLGRRIRAAEKWELFFAGHVFRDRGGLYLDRALFQRLEMRIDREWRERNMGRYYPNALPDDRPLLLLGLDGLDDLHVSARVLDFSPQERQAVNDLSVLWQVIAINLGNLVSFEGLNPMVERDRDLRAVFLNTPYVGAADPPFDNLDDYRVKTSDFLWRFTLDQRVEWLRTKEAPDTDLRAENLFPPALRAGAGPILEAWVRDVLERYP